MSWVFPLRRRFHIIRRDIRRGIREVPYIWLANRYHIGAGNYRRIYFYHIRKAAGTSLNHAMLSLGGEDGQGVYRRMHQSYRLISGNKIFAGWGQVSIEKGRYYYAFSHIPMHKLTLPPQTYTFTCFRDPVKRVVSHYKMLVRYRDNHVPHPCMVEEGPWLGSSFGDFLDNIPREHLQNQIYMFSASFDLNEAFDNILSCSRFLFVEDFERGLRRLADDLGVELQVRHAKRAANDAPISADERDRLREMLAPEYELIARLQREYAARLGLDVGAVFRSPALAGDERDD